MMSEVKLDIDLSVWMDYNGIELNLYIGEGDHPNLSKIEHYHDLVDKYLESYCVQGKIRDKDWDEAYNLIETLKTTVEYAEVKYKELRE